MAASRMNNMWPTPNDAGVATTTDIINMLQRNIISLPRAAELMHTTPSTISSYLEQVSMLRLQQDVAGKLLAANAKASVTVTPVGAAAAPLDMSYRASEQEQAVSISAVCTIRTPPPPPPIPGPQQPSLPSTTSTG